MRLCYVALFLSLTSPPGLHDLRYKAFILHRDVSLANIMCEIIEGKPRFILNDFDLACHLDDQGEPKGASPSIYRTGTLPFVAVDLLFDTFSPREAPRTPPVKTHRLRHDFESLFWTVLAGILLSQRNKVSREQWDTVSAELSQWEKGDLSTIACCKSAIINDATGLSYGMLPLPPLFAAGIPSRWLGAFKGVFAAPGLKLMEKALAKGEDIWKVCLTEAELDSMINKETILQAFHKVRL